MNRRLKRRRFLLFIPFFPHSIHTYSYFSWYTASALPAPTTYTVLPSSGTTSSSGLSPGALAGSIIGPICAVLVAAIGLGKVYLNYRKRNPKSAAADHGAGEQKGSGGDPGGDPGADDNYDKTVDPWGSSNERRRRTRFARVGGGSSSHNPTSWYDGPVSYT